VIPVSWLLKGINENVANGIPSHTNIYSYLARHFLAAMSTAQVLDRMIVLEEEG
jgi:hypothetical protein